MTKEIETYLNEFIKSNRTRVIAARVIQSTHQPVAKHLYLRIGEAPACERQRRRHDARVGDVVRNGLSVVCPRVIFLRRGEDISHAVYDGE